MATLRRNFGQRLRQIRQDAKQTQEEFAEVLGISVDFLSLIERGRNAPSFEKLEIMAEGLGKPVAYLFAFGNTDSEPQKRKSSRFRRRK